MSVANNQSVLFPKSGEQPTSRPPTPEEFGEAFFSSHELEPSRDFWGLFAYSDAPPNVCGSGLGSFQWFPTESDMVAFVRDYMAWWNPAPSSMTANEIADQVQSIVAAESEDLAKLRDELNDAMRKMWHIEWWGRFQDLCKAADEFPAKVRAAFFEDCDVPEAKSIPPGEVESFKEYLREYGS